MAAFDPRDRAEVDAARGNAGYGGGRPDPRDPRGGAMDSRLANPRTSSFPIASGPFSAQNLAALGNALLPGGVIRTGLGIGPGFNTTIGTSRSYEYDPTNRDRMLPQGASALYPNIGPGGQKLPWRTMAANPAMFMPRFQAAPRQPAPMAQAPGMFLQSGLPGYGTFRPGYNFTGPGGAF